jgi:hypothetical protein
MYKHFAAIPSAKWMTGSVLEAYGQQLFKQRISIEYPPKVQRPRQDGQAYECRWQSPCLAK